ncbi:hypothetical protein T05_12176 [Trichinella murrelli]|uniref:Uncharacterized protein n=1 Tax=Trichinella murrelli TaxID=144512 RepID=A0A0V0T3H5_9BILA|nr:hypothetical protein T05_12176 [Trichinella murrelli]
MSSKIGILPIFIRYVLRTTQCGTTGIVINDNLMESFLVNGTEFTLINDNDVQSLGDVCPVVEEQWASKLCDISFETI